MPSTTSLLDAAAVGRTLVRMASEIVEKGGGAEGLVLVGIQRRGVELAERLAKLIEGSEKVAVRRGKLDITLYRDDLQTVGPRPVVGPTDLPWQLDGARVVIVDDVLYTGRTVRAAMNELFDYGRPARISLIVLVDRGGRELPICPQHCGARIEVPGGMRLRLKRSPEGELKLALEPARAA